MRVNVHLHGVHVGFIQASVKGGFEFLPLVDVRSSDVPLLGQAFLDSPATIRTHPDSPAWRIPPWFGHLLPEGALRNHLAKQHGVRESAELSLLAALGDDVPGAAIFSADGELISDVDAALPSPNRLRFSLAGMQLKYSMLEDGGRLALPARGEAGRVIVKAASPQWRGLPEHEHAVLEWARAVGINAVSSRLGEFDELGVPPPPGEVESSVLVVDRFDRTVDGSRLHQEDFAQILGIETGDWKYGIDNELVSHDNLVEFVRSVAPEDSEELARRIVFEVVSLNGDAHAKNWAFLYPNKGRKLRLSPAYDLVSSVVFDNNDSLGMPIAGVLQIRDVDAGVLSVALGLDEDAINTLGKAILTTFEEADGFGMPNTHQVLLADLWRNHAWVKRLL